MKLYHNPLSPNSRRVRLTAAYVGLTLEEHVLDFAKGEHKSPGYLTLNPNGAIPTLVDGDFALTESRAIMQYLASKRPTAGLLPKDEQARADVTRWQFWDAAHFSPPLGIIAYERLLKAMMGLGDPDEGKIKDALASFRRFAAVLDGRLADNDYLVNNALTVADLTVASSLMYAQQADVPVGDFPNIVTWLGRITALDAWKRTAPGVG